MIIQYGISRAVQETGKRKRTEHNNGRLTVSGSPIDVGWSQKVRSLILARHPGWTVTGWAELDEGKANTRYQITAAFELGYKCCEQGLNLEAALAELSKHFR